MWRLKRLNQMEPSLPQRGLTGCCAWAVNQTMKPAKWLIIACSFMCDETRGNAHWQFLSCLFLCHTHTQKQRPLDSHNLHHLQCVSASQLPVAKPDPPLPNPPTPIPLQCKLKALLATQHICSSHPWESSVAYVQLGIRDLRSECHMNIAPMFWSAERNSERCEWVGATKRCTHFFFFFASQ